MANKRIQKWLDRSKASAEKNRRYRLEDENARLTAELKRAEEHRQEYVGAYTDLEDENERLTAALESAWVVIHEPSSGNLIKARNLRDAALQGEGE